MPSYFEFEVSLRYIRPRIWRRFLLAVDATFGDLHRAIQDSFGWDGGHLWEFRGTGRNDGTLAGPEFDHVMAFEDEKETPDAEALTLAGYFARSRGCQYLYDFGDSWLHDVKRNRRVSSSKGFHRQLLAGRRSCPPEDCGGFPGYDRFVSIVETGVDPWGENVGELLEWLGEWDLAAFDLADWKRRFDAKTALPPDEILA